MTQPVVIFGTGAYAEVVYAHLTGHGGFEIAGFAIDREYLAGNEKYGLPVVAFDEIADPWPPGQFRLLIAVAYARMNRVRRDRYQQAKDMGYSFISYVDPTTRIFPGTRIGENTVILDHNSIQPGAQIGDNVIIWSNNVVGHHSTIGDHCCVTSHVAIGGGVRLGNGCFLGANATLRDGLQVGDYTLVGAGCTILEDVPPESVFRAVDSKRSTVSSLRLRKI